MRVPGFARAVKNAVVDNAPSLLSAMAITGVVTTAYLASKATVIALEHVKLHEDANGVPEDKKEMWKGRVKVVWRDYVPAAASGVVTIGCIVGSTHISARRGAAAQAAFVLSERVYHEYRNQVIEEIGERKDQKIRDDIAERKVTNTPPSPTIISGPGNILCCELMTMRYFTSDMETLRSAQNELNARLLKHDRVTFEEWYDIIGLQATSTSMDIGWFSDRLMELSFSTIMSSDGRPCIAFDYNYWKPIYGGLFHE